MTAELDIYMNEEVKVSAKIKLLKDEKESLRTKILTVLALDEKIAHKTDIARLTYKTQTKRTLDREMLESFLAQHGKTIDDFKTASEGKVLRITANKTQEEM